MNTLGRIGIELKVLDTKHIKNYHQRKVWVKDGINFLKDLILKKSREAFSRHLGIGFGKLGDGIKHFMEREEEFNMVFMVWVERLKNWVEECIQVWKEHLNGQKKQKKILVNGD